MVSRTIDRTSILTLLAPRPRLSEDIARLLAAPLDQVKAELTRLVRAGVLKRTGQGSVKNYALASYVPRPGRPPLPGRLRLGPHANRLRCLTCREKQAKRAGQCRGCFTAAGGVWEQDHRCHLKRRLVEAEPIPQQFAVPRAKPAIETRILDGVAYDTVDYEALLERNATCWQTTSSYWERA